jgi:N-acetylneuraminic acid mutarotase
MWTIIGLTPFSSFLIQWSRGPDLPLPRGGYYAAWYSGGLVIAGGTYWKEGKKYWTDQGHFYGPVANKWSQWIALPRALAYGEMVEVNGNLYLLGGSDEKKIYRDIYRLTGNRWVHAGEMPAALVYFAAVPLMQRIYVLGGNLDVNDLTTGSTQAWYFDLIEKKWQTIDPVPGPPRLIHAGAALGKSIYIFGGASQKKGEPLKNLDDACRFDTDSGRWTRLNRTPVAARAWWAMPVGEDSIYLFGGYSEQFLDHVYRYDVERDNYEKIANLPLPLADIKFFHHDGIFYGAGGEDQKASRFSGTLIGRLKESKLTR